LCEVARRSSRVESVVVAAMLVAGCGPRLAEVPGPPPIPEASGPLRIDVVYPPNGSLITARDSNFIFGSVGSGDARLTINGRRVAVRPNGAFIAWLPVPAPASGALARYELVATLGAEERRVTRTVRLLPAPAALADDSAEVDVASLSPRGAWWVRRGEAITVRLRASPGARVHLLLPDGTTQPMIEIQTEPGREAANWIFGTVPSPMDQAGPSGVYEVVLEAASPIGRGAVQPDFPPVPATPGGVAPYCQPLVTDGPGTSGDDRERGFEKDSVPATCAVIEVAVSGDTARVPLPLDLWIMEGAGPVVALRNQPSGVGSDRYVVGRAAPGATTLWMWSDGVTARVTGRRDAWVRLFLDQGTEAWVLLDELVPLWRVSRPDRVSVGTVRFVGRPDYLAVRIDVDEPLPYQVRVDDQRVVLVLYGAYSNTDWMRYGPSDPFLRGAQWEQVSSDRYELVVDLTARPWGYRVRYVGEALQLDIRKPPSIDAERPLSGIRIAVDPGHPPGGATGPTRLAEADANLGVAYRLGRLLEAAGARVIMTRTDRSPVRIYDRTDYAELMGADILVSIHNNALPDGVNPFLNNGTSVYYFQPQSLDLARALQRNLLASLGLADLGVGRASLALARPSWLPAALTEGAFMMIPEQEAGLRNPHYSEAYARGVLEGLREFLRERVE
ncbi:MAG: N-acetylmuramoyl-L-alanine amidase, partial [Gemmatimonadales bacterium]